MVELHQSWLNHLQIEFDSDYMVQLREFLSAEKSNGKQVYPPTSQWFYALDKTPLNKVRVVILGQDPYHGEGQAHGLCFSVQRGIRTPPSLINIYKELHNDLNIEPAAHGDLTSWAEQGVLLLNSVLTVEAGNAGSHQKRGWERFTDEIIRLVAERDQSTVFIQWGAYAQKKAAFVDQTKHLVLKSVHPSPLSAHRGFFGSKPFSKTNEFLRANGQSPINWQIEPS